MEAGWKSLSHLPATENGEMREFLYPLGTVHVFHVAIIKCTDCSC